MTDTNRNNSRVLISGDSGATNITLNQTGSSNIFDGNFTPASLGCPTAGICTFTIYAVDLAENINYTTITALVDDVVPNVTLPSANASILTGISPVVTGAQQLNFNVTALENFNISNVTIGSGTTLGMVNVSNGNWSINASADDFGCTNESGVAENCKLTVTATDGAGNTNASITYNLTVDDIRPNVTLSAPTAGNSTIIATVSFNATVLEPNAGSGLVEITPAGQGATNYSLENRSGNWGFTNESMPDGVYTAVFLINDSLGNENFTVTTTFSVDTTVPAVSGAAANKSVVKSSEIIKVNITVTDTNRVDSNINISTNTTDTYNSSMSLSSGDLFQTNTTFTAQGVGCLTGINSVCVLKFSAEDAGGNINNTVDLTITVDDMMPNVTLVSPTNVTLPVSVDFNVSVLEDHPDNLSMNVVHNNTIV